MLISELKSQLQLKISSQKDPHRQEKTESFISDAFDQTSRHMLNLHNKTIKQRFFRVSNLDQAIAKMIDESSIHVKNSIEKI